MLEGLISSRIRRTLLEHLLKHPTEHFYLRGLAKELQLSVSPLRRELKRLQAQGLLRTYQEGNALFYITNQTSPVFLQLQHATSSIGDVQPVPAASVPVAAIAPPLIPSSRPRSWFWSPALVLTSVGMLVVGLIGVVLYVTITNQRLLAVTVQAASTPTTQLTVIHTEPNVTGLPAAAAAQAGEMRGSRLRLMPGSMGGFTTQSSEENY